MEGTDKQIIELLIMNSKGTNQNNLRTETRYSIEMERILKICLEKRTFKIIIIYLISGTE